MTAEVHDGVCILGMHRSGAGLTARVLDRLGVSFGDQQELAATARDDSRAHWELPEIVALNDDLLAALGGSADAPPSLPDGWEQSPELEPLRERARALLRERFAGEQWWGWKDPRNSLTLPFWRQVVSGIRCVVCVRSPIDVAQSLRADGNGGGEFEQHVSNWVRYTTHALEHTADGPRLVVDYEGFLADPEAMVRRLALFVGLEERLSNGSAVEALEAVDPTLALFRTPPAVAVADGLASREATALYRELRSGGNGTVSAPAEPARDLRLERRLAGVEELLAEKQEALHERHQRLREVNRELARARRGLERRDRIVAKLEERLAAQKETIAARTAKLARIEQRRAADQAALEEARASAASLEERADAETARVQELEQALAAAERDSHEASRAAAAAEQRAVAAERRAQQGDEELEGQRGVLGERDAAIAAMEAQVAELQRLAARELENVASRDERLVETNTHISELLGHIQRLKAAVEERDGRLQSQKQFIQDLQEDCDARVMRYQRAMHSMRDSRSWRLTKPLRGVTGASRRLTGRERPTSGA